MTHQDMTPRILNLHAMGITNGEIGRRLGVGRNYVRRQLRAAGVEANPAFIHPNRQGPLWDLDEDRRRAAIARRAAQGARATIESNPPTQGRAT